MIGREGNRLIGLLQQQQNARSYHQQEPSWPWERESGPCLGGVLLRNASSSRVGGTGCLQGPFLGEGGGARTRRRQWRLRGEDGAHGMYRGRSNDWTVWGGFVLLSVCRIVNQSTEKPLMAQGREQEPGEKKVRGAQARDGHCPEFQTERAEALHPPEHILL
mmetsp:Transcript_3206/g.6642  ORF Transcript_3206/g.6642 Transcript_3206/m.6642 type:complete len:162 (-) Transcript_3206:84-569(-)